MLSHISLGTSNLARATAFYDAILTPLGHVRQWTGERGVEYGQPGGEGKLAIFDVGEGARAPGDGWHLALTASTRQAVDAFHAIAMRMGAVDEGAPGLRPHYGAGYYAAFVRDLDGYKLEAVCHES
jgi:catechol 2,3-dioxygenase-like lactoylglutathione lyase family enzyme